MYSDNNFISRDFSSQEFADKFFRGAILENASFESSIFLSVHFQSANLKRASFRNAIIKESRFEGADLYFAKFQGAELCESNFNGAKLQGANFKDCKIRCSSFDGTEYDEKTKFPEGFIPIEHGLVEKRRRSPGKRLDNVESTKPVQKTFDKALEKIKGSIEGRQGQPEFRNQLIENYGNHCAFSGFEVPGLEAAHIKPYSFCEKHEKVDPRNGILLRADIHTLFDLGLIVIHPDYKIELEPSLLKTPYRKYNNQTLLLKISKNFNPSAEYLKWRLQNYSSIKSYLEKNLN